MPRTPPLPVTVLTGFLGSGKTTLLAQLLVDPAMSGTAVVINEWGEVGLDHHLLERLEGETVLLEGGCVCCSVREGLAATLHGLLQRARSGEIPAFQRIVVETTGMADPAPVLASLLADAELARALTVAAVVTTVDSVHGLQQLDAHLECVRQVAVADRIVLTKGDLAHPAVARRLRERLAAINPHAEVLSATAGRAAADLLTAPGAVRLREHADPAHLCDEHCAHEHGGHRHHAAHDARVRSHVFTFDAPLDWAVVSHWLGSLAFFHGERLLRIKGLLAVADEPGPVAVHGVRHLVHEPVALRAWPDEDRRSRIVFIASDLSRETLESALCRAREDARAAAVASPASNPQEPVTGPSME